MIYKFNFWIVRYFQDIFNIQRFLISSVKWIFVWFNQVFSTFILTRANRITSQLWCEDLRLHYFELPLFSKKSCLMMFLSSVNWTAGGLVKFFSICILTRASPTLMRRSSTSTTANCRCFGRNFACWCFSHLLTGHASGLIKSFSLFLPTRAHRLTLQL